MVVAEPVDGIGCLAGERAGSEVVQPLHARIGRLEEVRALARREVLRHPIEFNDGVVDPVVGHVRPHEFGPRPELIGEVAVVGVPMAGIDEIWAAVVSKQPIDAQAIAERAQSRLNEKTPNRILRVDAIPRNENGKVMRGELRELLLSRVRSAQ